MNPKLNSRLQPSDSLPARQEYVPAIQFESNYEVQGQKINASRVNIRNFVQNIATSSGTFAITNNTIVSLSTTARNAVPKLNDPSFALPHVALYLGTAAVGTNQIYPVVGAGIAAGSYNVWSGFDAHTFDGTLTTFGVSLTNQSGATGTVFYKIAWKYLQYNSGTVV